MNEQQIAAVKQALEALEYDTQPEAKCGINTAITALRQALEQQPADEPVGEIGWAANVPNSIREVHWKECSLPIGTKLYTRP